MTSRTKPAIITGGKYIAERVFSIFNIKLYLWEGSFYEVFFEYCDEKILRVEKVSDDAILDLYIEAISRKGKPTISEWDKEENLGNVGRMVKTIIEIDNPEFLNKLYWDEKLRWFCELIEVRSAYLVDDIQKKQKVSVSCARDIAIKKLLKDPESQTKPPYVEYSKGMMLFPLWYINHKTEQGILIEAEYLYGNGVSQLLARFNDLNIWMEALDKDYAGQRNILG